MAQPETGGVRTTEGEGDKLETASDDEEITIPSQDSADIQNVDIRGEQSENTQREDWLLPTEPRHGARPRQTGAEHPPAMEDSVFRTLRLSPGSRIDMEEEVLTPPRGGRQVPKPQGVQKEARAVPKIFPEDTKRDGGQGHKNVGSPIDTLVNTVSHMQRLDHTPGRKSAISQVIQAPRRVALTTTKVPLFDGTTSWEQYHQVFEAIVRSNGWDNDTAALQLFSHLEGDALNVAHLVPLARRLLRSGLIDVLTAHYGSPGRLADYRRQFERTTRKVGEDPAIFATALETLAVKAFGDMGQTARLRLIRDRFIAGHDNCDLRRHLESVPPETPIRDVVDRCRVWESHADPIVRRMTKPTPDVTYPTYAVGNADKDREVIKVAAKFTPADSFGCRAAHSDTGDIRHKETVAAVNKSATGWTGASCRHPSAADTGTDIAICPRWTTPMATTAPKTATTSETTASPEGLVRCNLFLLQEDWSCSNTLSGL